MNKVSFALVIHSHQPVGNFDHVIEEAYQRAYAPFVQILLQHPRVRLSLHYSGILLEWLEERHPEFSDQLSELSGRGQVELLGGGYYEPILPSIPVETISQSELGFERVQQGSAILAVWKIDPASWRDVTGVLRAEVAPWAGPARDDDNGA